MQPYTHNNQKVTLSYNYGIILSNKLTYKYVHTYICGIMRYALQRPIQNAQIISIAFFYKSKTNMRYHFDLFVYLYIVNTPFHAYVAIFIYIHNKALNGKYIVLVNKSIRWYIFGILLQSAAFGSVITYH